jgi:RNA polymerase sigma-70 factor (ECF subfamily)
MKNADKQKAFELLRPWLAGTADHGSQVEIAAELGVSETAVRVQVHRLRKRFREIVEAEVGQTLEPGGDVAGELRHLLAVW